MIKYFRDKIEYLKKEKNQVVKDMEEVKMNVQTVLGPQYKKMY